MESDCYVEEPKPDKPILCCDFDGVIHSYDSGWQGADVITDPPVDGAFDFLKRAMAYWDVRIYSSRSIQPGGIEAMKAWFTEHGWPDANGLSFPKWKPPANMTIDDRAFCFEGKFPDPKALRDFKPWNKRG